MPTALASLPSSLLPFCPPGQSLPSWVAHKYIQYLSPLLPNTGYHSPLLSSPLCSPPLLSSPTQSSSSPPPPLSLSDRCNVLCTLTLSLSHTHTRTHTTHSAPVCSTTPLVIR